MSGIAAVRLPESKLKGEIAPVWHSIGLIVLLLVPILQALGSRSVAAVPKAVPFYLTGFAFLWVLFAYAWWGLRLRRIKVTEVIRARWLRAADVARDFIAAAVFWVLWYGALNALKQLLTLAGLTNKVSSGMVYPHGAGQTALWILCSASAGFVEEFVFRGLLIRQFAAWTHSTLVAVVLQAVLFGVSHGFYLGVRQVTIIVASGLLIGVFTQSRRTLAPAMVFHTWADIFGAAIVRGLPFA